MNLWRQSGEKPELLQQAVPIPTTGADVWGHFCQLSSERSEGRITSGMMRDYEWSEGITLELWQRKAIKRLDTVLMKSKDKIK